MNDAPEEIYFAGGASSSSITISYSNIQDEQGGIVTDGSGTVNWLNGNIGRPPVFLDAFAGDYRLDDTSPCIGAGTINDVPLGVSVPSQDIEDNPRPAPPGRRRDPAPCAIREWSPRTGSAPSRPGRR